MLVKRGKGHQKSLRPKKWVLNWVLKPPHAGVMRETGKAILGYICNTHCCTVIHHVDDGDVRGAFLCALLFGSRPMHPRCILMFEAESFRNPFGIFSPGSDGMGTHFAASPALQLSETAVERD